jgi:hypothetical protein
MIDSGLINARTDYVDMFGWEEITASVARIYDGLPASERYGATIWAINYGEAGAIDLYGPRYGLPPVISAHLTYFYWKPAHIHEQTVIVVGGWKELLAPLFADVRPAGVIGNAFGVRNAEVGRFIFVCRRPRTSLDQAWASLQLYD